MKKLAILGASGHGKVVAEIAELNGWDVVFFDDAYPDLQTIEHWSLAGTTHTLMDFVNQFDGCIVAIGNCRIRLAKQLELENIGFSFPKLFHPNAIISRFSTIGAGSVFMANAVINPFVTVGKACIINTSATVDHDCLLADGVHISPGVNIAGAVSVGECSWIGIGSAVKQCLQIGSDAMVGAGAAVVSDIPNDLTVVGVPAKPL